jgi:hypothetical protein
MPDVGKSHSFYLALQRFQIAAFQHAYPMALRADHVVVAISVVKLVTDRPVPEIATLDQTDLLESRKAPIDRYKIAPARSNSLMKIFNGERPMLAEQLRNQPASRLSQPKPPFPQ